MPLVSGHNGAFSHKEVPAKRLFLHLQPTERKRSAGFYTNGGFALCMLYSSKGNRLKCAEVG